MRYRALAMLSLVASASVSLDAGAAPLTPAQRTERAAVIRDVAADNGISAGFLFAGIAQAETNLSHCWEELSWACQGPNSVDCGGGPVVAGAGDGPCSLQQGGLGMFQFDGGTFDQTIARDGDGVLLLSGNITRAIDFVVNMLLASQYVDVTTPDEAKAWMNQVTVDGPLWDDWITTVTHYYNGCTPTGCSVFEQRYQHYADATADVYFEQGEDFWVVDLPPCGAVPALGRTLEETDTCFTKGGPLAFWRVGIGGESNLHVWTRTTDADTAANYAEWTLSFDEAGRYLVEVSATKGTTPLASYLIEHDATSSEIVVDQSQVDGFVELGEFEFAAGGEQRVFIGDHTGDVASERLVVDALRLTRLDPGGGGGAGGSGASSGAGGDDGGDDGGGAGDPADDAGSSVGCSCTAGASSSGGDAAALALLLGLAATRARRRSTARRTTR